MFQMIKTTFNAVFLHLLISWVMTQLYMIKEVFFNVSSFSEWFKVYVYVCLCGFSMAILFKMKKLKQETTIFFLLITVIRSLGFSFVYDVNRFPYFFTVFPRLIAFILMFDIHYDYQEENENEKDEKIEKDE